MNRNYKPNNNRRQKRRQQAPTSPVESPTSSTITVLEEASRKPANSTGKGTANRSLSMAWDESEALGIPSAARREGLMSDRDRKDTLYKAWLGNVWISSAIDVIAKRITSGGVHIKEAPGVKQGEGDPKEFELLNELVNRVNDDEDFLYLVRGTLTDIGIFGESYWELVPFLSPEVGKTLALVKIDCITMSYKLAPNGQIVGYEQNMDRYQDSVTFTAEEVVRWWLPDPRASKKALSPIERILGPTDADSRMQDWTRLFFKRGARPNLWIEFLGGKDEAERFIIYLRENYTGQLNAHVPLVTYEGAKVHEIGKGTVDVDFVKGREMARQEVLAAFLVPPALVGIIESGNIGGGTGESQNKSLQYNACDPLKSLFLEKFNFRVVKKGLNIKSWVIDTHYASYMQEKEAGDIQDKRIRNGSLTINEVRQEMGREPLDGGDTAIVVASREIDPVEVLSDMADNARQQNDLQLQQQQAQVELAKAQVERAKNPQPVPPAFQQGQNGNRPAADTQTPPRPQNGAPPAQESLETRLARALADVQALQRERDGTLLSEDTVHNTGMMLAFMLDEETARHLAIPGGEDPSEMHLTLAYLGDTQDEPADGDGKLRPHTSPERLITQLNDFTQIEDPAFDGTVNGIARLSNPDADEDAIVALVNMPGLQAWRNMTVRDALVGYYVAQTFDFVAHITIAYVPKGAPMPVEILPPVALHFDTICLVIGDERYYFRFGYGQLPPYGGSTESQLPALMSRIEDALHGFADVDAIESDTPIEEALQQVLSDVQEASQPLLSPPSLATTVLSGNANNILLDLSSFTIQEASRPKWRAPSAEQLHLEAQMQTAIQDFIRRVKVGDGGTVQIPAMASLTQSIADWLEQAHALGVATADTRSLEALSIPKPKDWFGKATQIMQTLVTNIADKVSEWIDDLTGDSDVDDSDIVDEVTAELEAYAGTEAELIALYEVPDAFNNGMLETFQDMGYATVQWVTMEGNVCPACQENADAGSIAIGSAFPSGDTSPPNHPRCRCQCWVGEE